MRTQVAAQAATTAADALGLNHPTLADPIFRAAVVLLVLVLAILLALVVADVASDALARWQDRRALAKVDAMQRTAFDWEGR